MNNFTRWEKFTHILDGLADKPMQNTDRGLAYLFLERDSARKAKNKPVPTEPDSKGELPEIDYPVLREVSVVDVKDQDCQFQPQKLGLNGRTLAVKRSEPNNTMEAVVASDQ